ncbi:hypothetical protein BS50DRAFT_485741 [Corynespora cassiicola Philippines]|uniref:Uncharacterized protein n=1 Tax=Corynespora cassiicola Philippines TaxID=1448308 RepID=A0A2T2NZC8_CORCC|nr:hypothetical protein BS50DRAFT_485741 [Corynespora cassiicola Philippines]
MGDARPSLLPPSRGSFTPATPSGLTPNTRSEAEAALTLNSVSQTDSAAPTTPLAPGTAYIISEAQRAYRRPPGPLRTSSTNYEQALKKAHEEVSASSDLSADTKSPVNLVGGPVGSPTASVPFPPPGQGVVPLHSGVGMQQAEALKRAKPRGMSLGSLARQQSWNEQDMRHVYTAALMGEVKGDAGYSSGTEGKGVGV